MRGQFTVIACLLFLTAFTQANIIEDAVSGLETLAKIPQIEEVAKALISLEGSNLGETFEHCIRMGKNSFDEDTCLRCENDYMSYCTRSWNTYIDNEVCTCKIPNPPHCKTYYNRERKMDRCISCFDYFNLECKPLTPESTKSTCQCIPI